MTSKTREIWIVEGTYDNDGGQITGDYVMAGSADEAECLVSEVRSVGADEWTYHSARTLQGDVDALLEDLKKTPEEIMAGLEFTLEGLNGVRCKDCRVPFYEEEVDENGRCEGCAEQAQKGDDMCDICHSSGVEVVRTYKGQTVCVECDKVTPYESDEENGTIKDIL